MCIIREELKITSNDNLNKLQDSAGVGRMVTDGSRTIRKKMQGLKKSFKSVWTIFDQTCEIGHLEPRLVRKVYSWCAQGGVIHEHFCIDFEASKVREF